MYELSFLIKQYGVIFTKRQDVLPANLVKSRIPEIR